MRLARRVARLEARPSGLPKPDPRYPESVRLYEDATARAQVRRAMRQLIAAMWHESGNPERAAAARRCEADVMGEWREAWTALGETGQREFRQAARALLERLA